MAQFGTPPPGKKPKREFLLGLGKPFEQNPWDCDSASIDDAELLMASQVAEEEMPERKPQQSTRWGPPTSTIQLEKIRKNGIPKNTQKQTEWSLSVWTQWSSWRSQNLIESDEYEYELTETFVTMSEEAMLFWLPKFITEVRRSDGNSYPPNSVYQICCGLSRALRSANRSEIDIFNSPKFSQFRDTLDSCMKTLKASGNFQVQKAENITEEVEDLLWSKGLLGDSTPQCLFDTLVFYLGLYFALQSSLEHRRLRHNPSQLALCEPPGGIAYLKYQDVSKTNQGGLKHRKDSKVVVQYANTQSQERCIVRLFSCTTRNAPQIDPTMLSI